MARDDQAVADRRGDAPKGVGREGGGSWQAGEVLGGATGGFEGGVAGGGEVDEGTESGEEDLLEGLDAGEGVAGEVFEAVGVACNNEVGDALPVGRVGGVGGVEDHVGDGGADGGEGLGVVSNSWEAEVVEIESLGVGV